MNVTSRSIACEGREIHDTEWAAQQGEVVAAVVHVDQSAQERTLVVLLAGDERVAIPARSGLRECVARR